MFGSMFKKKISIDEAVESILSGLVKFDRMQVWGAELSRVSGLHTERAKEEMFYLDCFAVYVFLKFNRSPNWKQNGIKIFEKIFQACAIFVATTFANKDNATIEEVRNASDAIDRRFAVYGPLFERSEDTLLAIGTAFSKFCQVDGNSVLIQTGADLFNVRGQMLIQFANEHPVSN